jgi:hypothetical protein
MSQKLFCDRCDKEIVKLPNKVIANKREIDLCNDCWKGLVIFLGKGVYTSTELTDYRNKKD